MNTINVLGEFWIPSEPDHRATGILSFSPDEGACLALVRKEHDNEGTSALWQFSGSSLTDIPNIPRIDGLGIYDMEKKQACARRFSLENCMSLGTSFSFWLTRFFHINLSS